MSKGDGVRVFPKEEIILLVDFNGVDENDQLAATLRYAIFLRKPKVNDWVRLDDGEGHSCLGRVERITGELIKVTPYWDTWTTEARTPPRFSSSYLEHPRTGVQGSEDKPRTTGVNAQLHAPQVGA